MLTAAVTHGWLAADGLLVVERSVRTPELAWPLALPEGWSRRYGETVLYYRTGPAPESE
jgi:16S rRNA (guanine966-N2)-methyltransferase